MGWAPTALLEPAGTLSSGTTKMMLDRSIASESIRTAATVAPTESEIARVAYQMWLSNGCRVGSDQEDWFRAEATLRNTLVAKCEDLSRLPSVPRCEVRTESEMRCEFRWNGHWEAWEMEWGGARWIWN